MGQLAIWIGSAIAGAFVSIIGTLVGKVLMALAVGVVTYTGVSATIGWLKTSFVTAALGLPAGVVGMLSVMHVGSCVSMVFSAMVIRLTLNGMSSDTVKSWVKK